MARVKVFLADLAELPPICVCCGKPATRVRRQEFRLDQALSAAVLVASTVVGAAAWTERGITFSLPVCDSHRRRGRRSNQTFLWGFVLTVVLGVAAYLAAQFHGAAGNYLTVAAMFAFIITMVLAMHEVNDGLAVKSLTRDSFTLTGVHRKFAEAVESREQELASRAERIRDPRIGLSN